MVHPYKPSGTAGEFVTQAARIATDVALPHADEVDAQPRFPAESMKALAEQGFYGLCLPKESGGKGEGMRAFAGVVDELAAACASTAMVYVMHTCAAQAIAAARGLANRDSVLKEIAAGKHLTTLAFSESGSRSQFWAPVSRLEESQGDYVVSARKSWVTSAAHADSYVATSQKPGAASPLESTVYFVRSKGLLNGLAAGTNWVFRDESMHINFAFEVINTVRAESPELFDAEFEKQIVAMLEEAVDCETAFAEDLLGQGVAGLSLTDMRAYLESVADQRLQSFGIKKRYGARNPFSFMELQDVQELTNFFERRVSAYQIAVSGSVALHEEF